MKAVLYKEYGSPDVLYLADVAKPSPKANEVLIKIRATTVTAGDWRMRKADPVAARLFNGLLKPSKVKILGFECAGDIEAVGRDVTRFHEGDAVFAFAGFGFGCHAEYISIRCDETRTQQMIAAKPANVSYEQAAAIPVGGITALAFMRMADIQRGQKVLIYGASGSVGTYAIQIARHMGAEVTGVCSTANIPMIKALGAEHVIDYTQQDFAELGAQYDLVFDAVGKAEKSKCTRVLAPKGRYLSVTGSPKLRPDDLSALAELAEAGALRPVIDRCYPLEEVAAAHRYVEGFHKKGNVVLTL